MNEIKHQPYCYFKNKVHNCVGLKNTLQPPDRLSVFFQKVKVKETLYLFLFFTFYSHLFTITIKIMLIPLFSLMNKLRKKSTSLADVFHILGMARTISRRKQRRRDWPPGRHEYSSAHAHAECRRRFSTIKVRLNLKISQQMWMQVSETGMSSAPAHMFPVSSRETKR